MDPPDPRIVVVAAGIGLLTGQTWPGSSGSSWPESALANFLFLPHYPLWSILVIALDVMIIWALLSMVASSDHTRHD